MQKPLPVVLFNGGEARIVGNEIQDSSVSGSEEVTLVAVAYSGYKFMGWISNDGSEVPNANSATLKVSKANALNKIFIAQFAKITEDININGATDDGIII